MNSTKAKWLFEMIEKRYKTSAIVKHVLPDETDYVAYVGTDLTDAAEFVSWNENSIPKDERYDIYYRCEVIE